VGLLDWLGLDLAALTREYGYWFVFAGTFLEGEATLVVGMVAASQGLLDPLGVALVAFVGTYLGDLAYYVIGIRYALPFLARFPRVAGRVSRISGWVKRYDIAIILANRFLYGFRIAAPIALGMSAVPAWRFVVFNVAGVAIWTAAIGVAGYLFGTAIESLLQDARMHDELLMAAVVLLIATLLSGRWIARRLTRNGG
jgi:membrane protein DedA with SNARE-associated domain